MGCFVFCYHLACLSVAVLVEGFRELWCGPLFGCCLVENILYLLVVVADVLFDSVLQVLPVLCEYIVW